MRSRTQRRAHAGKRAGAGKRAAADAADDADSDAEFLGRRYARIYEVVRRIPRGRVLTYGAVAELAGMPRAARVVGAALRVSSAAASTPWQRVVGKRRPGWAHISIHDPLGASIQRSLLEAEGVCFSDSGGISLADYGWDGSTRGA